MKAWEQKMANTMVNEHQYISNLEFSSDPEMNKFVNDIKHNTGCNAGHILAAIGTATFHCSRNRKHKTPGYSPYRFGHHVLLFANPAKGKTTVINAVMGCLNTGRRMAQKYMLQNGAFTSTDIQEFILGQDVSFNNNVEHSQGVIDDDNEEHNYIDACINDVVANIDENINAQFDADTVVDIQFEKKILLSNDENHGIYLKAARTRQLWQENNLLNGQGIIKASEYKSLIREFNKEDPVAAMDVFCRTADPAVEGRTYTGTKYNTKDVQFNQTVIICGGVPEDAVAFFDSMCIIFFVFNKTKYITASTHSKLNRIGISFISILFRR